MEPAATSALLGKAFNAFFFSPWSKSTSVRRTGFEGSFSYAQQGFLSAAFVSGRMRLVTITTSTVRCGLNYLIWPSTLPIFLKEANLLLPELNGSRCPVTNHCQSINKRNGFRFSKLSAVLLALEPGEWASV